MITTTIVPSGASSALYALWRVLKLPRTPAALTLSFHVRLQVAQQLIQDTWVQLDQDVRWEYEEAASAGYREAYILDVLRPTDAPTPPGSPTLGAGSEVSPQRVVGALVDHVEVEQSPWMMSHHQDGWMGGLVIPGWCQAPTAAMRGWGEQDDEGHESQKNIIGPPPQYSAH